VYRGSERCIWGKGGMMLSKVNMKKKELEKPCSSATLSYEISQD
jgi:hypothetical protein